MDYWECHAIGMYEDFPNIKESTEEDLFWIIDMVKGVDILNTGRAVTGLASVSGICLRLLHSFACAGSFRIIGVPCLGAAGRGEEARGAMEVDVKKPTKSNNCKDNTADPSYAPSNVGKATVTITACHSGPSVADHCFVQPGKEENNSGEFKEKFKFICSNPG